MKPASAGLIALLSPSTGAKQFIHADLFTWTLVTGAVSRYTSADINLTIGGNTFLSTNSLFKRGKTTSQLGLQIPSLDVTVSPRSTDQIGGVGWLSAARSGALDGATVLVERFISDSWTNTAVGSLYQFLGYVSGITFDRSKFVVKLVPPTTRLNRRIPLNQYQTTCVHTLYDGANGVNGCSRDGNTKASKTVTGTVSSGSTANSIRTGLSQADGYFNLGAITFTSGANNGLQRTVDSFTHSGGVVAVPLALPVAPSNGDTFSIYPGCNKLYTGDCLGKFSNQANFKATPFVPVAETAF